MVLAYPLLLGLVLAPLLGGDLRRLADFRLRAIPLLDLAPVDDWILQHHERWDGLGYPNGRAGEQIPLGARIIHAADAFEAITARRPYSPARSVAWALAELKSKAGTQFDPQVVAAFERYLASRSDPRALVVA